MKAEPGDWKRAAKEALDRLELVDEVRADFDENLERLIGVAVACKRNKTDRIRWTDLRDRWNRIAKYLEEAAKEVSAISDIEYDFLEGVNPWDQAEILDERIEQERMENWKPFEHFDNTYEKRSYEFFKKSGHVFPLKNFEDAPEGPPQLKTDIQNQPVTLEERLWLAAELFRLRIQTGEELNLGGSGAADLQTRIHQSPNFTFAAECLKMFLKHQLPFTDSESGAFFKFCREIWEADVDENEFRRDGSFRSLVKTGRALGQSEDRIQELSAESARLNKICFDDGLPKEEQMKACFAVRRIAEEIETELKKTEGFGRKNLGKVADRTEKPNLFAFRSLTILSGRATMLRDKERISESPNARI